MTLLEMRDAVEAELTAELLAVLGASADASINRWINQGRRRLDYLHPTTSALTWAAEDTTVALPSTCWEVTDIVPGDGVSLDPYLIHGSTLYFRDPNGSSTDGTATLFYRAIPAELDADADVSELPALADDAAIAYTLHRFFRRLSASRSNYERYATIAGANAVDITELQDLADTHREEFEQAREGLFRPESATFFGE